MVNEKEIQDNKNKETSRIRRSDELGPVVRKELKKYAKKFHTKEELAEDLGIARGTLRTVLKYGICNTETKNKIISKLDIAA